MLAIKNITPGMLSVIILSLYHTPFDCEEWGNYYIYRDDFEKLISERDQTIPEGVFMAEFIEWLHQYSLTFSPYNTNDFVVLYVPAGLANRFADGAVMELFSPL